MDALLYTLLIVLLAVVSYFILFGLGKAFGPPGKTSYVDEHEDKDFASEKDRWPNGGPPK